MYGLESSSSTNRVVDDFIMGGILTVAGIISQSSYQSPTFERRRARNRRQTAISAIAHINKMIPPKLVSWLVGLLESEDCCICNENSRARLH